MHGQIAEITLHTSTHKTSTKCILVSHLNSKHSQHDTLIYHGKMLDSDLDKVGLKIVSIDVVRKKTMQNMRKIRNCPARGGSERL